MFKYKVDWLAFSVSFEGEETMLDYKILELLGYHLADFEEVPGRYFYNSGATLGNYVNVYWNDPDKPRHKNSSRTMTVVFTGQGSTDLAQKWDNDWFSLFKMLSDYAGRVNFTRLDLALDDYSGRVEFIDIEKKLNKGHYRSSRKSYNIVKTSDTQGRTLGQTIYIGKAKSSGSRGNVYARFYDKRAQYIEKNQLFPSEVKKHWAETGREVWQRYEISFSKKYAGLIVDQFLAGDKVDKIFKSSLRDLLEILTPRSGDANKARWYKTKWWEQFLAYDEAMDFSLAERDVMLGDLLEWLRVSVLPSLALLEQIGDDRGFDVYDLLRQARKPMELSKKQARLLANSQTLSDDIIKGYLKHFLDPK